MSRLYHLMEKWSLVLETGATPPVDSWPVLKWIPQRLMGNWRTRATECGTLMTDLYTEVLEQVRDRRQRGVDKGSFMDIVLEKQDKNQFSTHQLAFLGGTLMEGGSDTSSSLILATIQAMTEYPDVQKRYISGDMTIRAWLISLSTGHMRKLTLSLRMTVRLNGRIFQNYHIST